MRQSNFHSPLALVRELELRSIAEANGTLVPITGNVEIPFAIARVFYIYGVDRGTTRGEHAHIKCQQAFVCLHGACKVTLDDGMNQLMVLLDSPSKGIFIPTSIWTSQTFLTDNALLVVFTDRPYDEADYMRNYSDFLTYRGVSQREDATQRWS